MLNRKPQIEDRKKDDEEKLAARLQLLKSQGKDDELIQKDTCIKQIKARIRKAKHQMKRIDEMKNQVAEKIAAKAQKAAQPKAPPQDKKKPGKSMAPRKSKKQKPVSEEE